MTKKAPKPIYKIRTLRSTEKTTSEKTAIDLARWIEAEFPGRCVVVEKHANGTFETILTINGN